MIKYKISKHISIYKSDGGIPAKFAGDYFIMNDEIRDNEYLINASIKYYIDKFTGPKSEKEVLQEIETELQSTCRELHDACAGFFDFLRRARILVPENTAEETVSDAPLYNEGDIIDNFRILKIVSSRSYTDIYSAASLTDGTVYVIKLLNRKKITSDCRYRKELANLELEYKMLQKAAQIPAISKAYGFDKPAPDIAYLLLEYIEGKPLSRLLEEELKTLTDAACLTIAEAVISSFSQLHEKRIIHGDIHASNILVTSDMRVKIIDLGMSRHAEVQENEVMRSGGVYYYMPPERISIGSFEKFSKDADLYSDVYQLGILIYFILYHTFPFDGFTWEELAQSIKEDVIEYPASSSFGYPVSRSLVHIVKKCLDKDPLKRYIDASAILADFRKAFSEKELSEL